MSESDNRSSQVSGEKRDEMPRASEDEGLSSQAKRAGADGRDRAQPERASVLGGFLSFLRPRANGSIRSELAEALQEATSPDAGFSPEERAMLRNILRLREIRVEDVMIPRAEVEAVDMDTTLGELLEVFEESGHSRMPVFCETLDDPRGMVHIRDVVSHLTRTARQKTPRRRKVPEKATLALETSAAKAVAAAGNRLDLARVDLEKTVRDLSLMRKVLFVPPSMLASDLMARMQAERIQMALVIDEYGGTDGLVSLEDIVEMVVGDIEDEHDEDEPMIVQVQDGIWLADARAELDEVAGIIGPAFVVGEHGEDVDTLGGLIFSVLGRVPRRGEVVQAVPGYEFHVLDVDPRRIRKVRIVQLRPSERRRRIASRPAAPAEPPSTGPGEGI